MYDSKINTDKFTINRRLILSYLQGPESADGEESTISDDEQDFQCTNGPDDTDLVAPQSDFRTIRAWLDTLCEAEVLSTQCFKPEDEEFVGSKCAKTFFKDTPLGMDSSILARVLTSDTTSNFASEDLIVPLRLGKAALERPETYEEILEILLTWNRSVTEQIEATTETEQLIDALHARLDAIDQVLESGRSGKESTTYTKVGDQGILEPSARNLLRAIHKFRPETVHFKTQDPFAILILFWANMRKAVPDIEGHDALMYPTFRVLTAETELLYRFKDEKIRRDIRQRRQQARRNQIRVELQYRDEQMRNYNKTVAKESIQMELDKIKLARLRLQVVVLDELLELTQLQAAQSMEWRASKNLHFNAPWSELVETCVQADTDLDSVLEDTDDLEIISTALIQNVQEMCDPHHAIYTRAIDSASVNPAVPDKEEESQVTQQQKDQSVTALWMSEMLNEVLQSQETARQILSQTSVMEESLNKLETTATVRMQAYGKLLRLVELTSCDKLCDTGVQIGKSNTLAESMGRTIKVRHTVS